MQKLKLGIDVSTTNISYNHALLVPTNLYVYKALVNRQCRRSLCKQIRKLDWQTQEFYYFEVFLRWQN
jgi:hypothetical protein